MKTLLLIILSFTTLQSFAGVGGSVGGTDRTSRMIQFGKRLVTLEDFDNSLSHVVHWPTVLFANLSTPVKNVCADGSTLKTINPIKVCTKREIVEVCEKGGAHNEEERCRPVRSGEILKESFNKRFIDECVSTVNKNFETSKFYEASVCVKWGLQKNEIFETARQLKCIVFANETREYPDSYEIEVTKSGNGKENKSELVTKLRFEVPECKK